LFTFSGNGAGAIEESCVVIDTQSPAKDKKAMAEYLSAKFDSSRWAEELAIFFGFKTSAAMMSIVSM